MIFTRRVHVLLLLSSATLALAGHYDTLFPSTNKRQRRQSAHVARKNQVAAHRKRCKVPSTPPSPTLGSNFKLADNFQGNNFFDGFDFKTFPDPTHGNVEYVSSDEAFGAGLASVGSDGVAFMTVDNKNGVPEGGNRKSVRIESKKSYNQGLFVLDVAAMPHGPSVWPAFWMVGPNWPAGGEIDIIEGVHDQQSNQMTLHTSPGCTLDDGNFSRNAPAPNMKTLSSVFTGTVLGTNCDAAATGNAGCGVLDNGANSYGAGFNQNGGGVVATLWDDSGVRIWRFTRDSIPADLAAQAPNPASWPAPQAFWSSSKCGGQFFKDMNMVFDTTLCGDWAGATFNHDTGLSGTCQQWVSDPSHFNDAHWLVNYVRVFTAA